MCRMSSSNKRLSTPTPKTCTELRGNLLPPAGWMPSVKHKALGEAQHLLFPDGDATANASQLLHRLSALKPHLLIMPDDVVPDPSLNGMRQVLEEREQMVRLDGKVSVGCLDEELAADALDACKDLPLNLPGTDVLQKRVAIDDIHRTIGEGQVGGIGDDERGDVGVSAGVTRHDVQSNHLVADAELGQLIFELAIAVTDVEYGLAR